MPATQRVTRLRRESLDAVPSISTERAHLMTEFYRKNWGKDFTPVFRAKSFAYLMDHKEICINPGELIVGEKGPSPKATPTYPELCCHSLSDLDILDSREKIPFKVRPEDRQLLRGRGHPLLGGQTMRERLFAEMTPEWIDAYEAGIFTEFMEQRAPGHTVLDDKIYRKGMLDFQREIDAALARLDFLNDPQAYAKQEELKAMRITAEALIRFAGRHAEKARQLAAGGNRPAAQSRAGAHRRDLLPGSPPTPRAISGKRCNITGSSTWASPPSSTPGIRSAPGASTSTSTPSTSRAWPTAA